MLISTTEEIAGKPIVEVLGLVSGKTSYGISSGEALNEVVEQMKRAAEQQGANAIVGVKFTVAIGSTYSMMLAYGTAVVVDEGGRSYR